MELKFIGQGLDPDSDITAGNFIIEVYRNWAPLAADRFYQLVKTGYYNNCLVFRALKNSLVQFAKSRFGSEVAIFQVRCEHRKLERVGHKSESAGLSN